MSEDDDQKVRDSYRVVEEVRHILHGEEPEVVGAALAELTSLWLAGHSKTIRDDIFAAHMMLILKLTPLTEIQLFGPDGHPSDIKPRGHDND